MAAQRCVPAAAHCGLQSTLTWCEISFDLLPQSLCALERMPALLALSVRATFALCLAASLEAAMHPGASAAHVVMPHTSHILTTGSCQTTAYCAACVRSCHMTAFCAAWRYASMRAPQCKPTNLLLQCAPRRPASCCTPTSHIRFHIRYWESQSSSWRRRHRQCCAAVPVQLQCCAIRLWRVARGCHRR